MLRSSQTYFVPDDVCVPCVRRLNHQRSVLSLSRSLTFVCFAVFRPQRVRHSETASGDNREFTVLQEMMCTMRVWQKTRGVPPAGSAAAATTTSGGSPHHKADGGSHRTPLSSPFDSASLRIPASEFRNTGPELVLTPLINPLLAAAEQQQQQQHYAQQLCCVSDFSNPFPTEFTSFGSGSPTAAPDGTIERLRLSSSGVVRGSHRPALGTVTIPMRDILLVGVSDTDTTGSNKNAQHRTTVATASAGFYELAMDNTNGQLVLMTFLKANLPKSKVGDLNRNLELPRSPSNLTQNTLSTKSFDVEAFTATRMTERLQSESVAEKVQRRIHRLVTSLEESEYERVLGGS